MTKTNKRFEAGTMLREESKGNEPMVNKLSDRITYENAKAFTFLEMTEKAMDAENKAARLEAEMKNKDERAAKFAKDAFDHTSKLMAEIAKLKEEIESLKS